MEELEKEETKQQFEVDKEGITEEERYMLRKVGVKMGPFLLLGESQFIFSKLSFRVIFVYNGSKG